MFPYKKKGNECIQSTDQFWGVDVRFWGPHMMSPQPVRVTHHRWCRSPGMACRTYVLIHHWAFREIRLNT